MMEVMTVIMINDNGNNDDDDGDDVTCDFFCILSSVKERYIGRAL